MRVEVRIEDADPGEEVEVIAVHAQVGATVAAGDPLLEVETDKANMDLPAPAAGTVVEIIAEGEMVAADAVFAVIDG